MAIVSYTSNITIDRSIGAPGNGKSAIDVLNAPDIIFLRKKTQQIIK